MKDLFDKLLQASYLYYIAYDGTPWSDVEYDSNCRELLKNWDTFEHDHKRLADKEALEAGSLYHISEYPPGIIKRANEWAAEHESINRL